TRRHDARTDRRRAGNTCRHRRVTAPPRARAVPLRGRAVPRASRIQRRRVMDRLLKDDHTDDFERFLLESADEEAPSPELRSRVLTGLGVTAVVAGSAGTSTSLGGAGSASAAPAGVASGAVKAIVVKGLVVIAGFGAASGVVAVVQRTSGGTESLP